MHYDLAVVEFDPETGRMGDRVITIIPAGENLSFSHPKASPDGRWLMVTAAQYGTFPVWHKESELWLIDLQTRRIDVLPQVNAYGADTYHSWSGNSRWIVWASRRIDGLYSRLFIAHIDKDGKASKPFLMPQKDMGHDRMLMKSYNVPEFISGPVRFDQDEMADMAKNNPGIDVTFK